MQGTQSRMPLAEASPKTIVFLAAPDTQILDVGGPYQIFVRAAEIYIRENRSRKMPYEVQLLSCTSQRSVETNCGLVLAKAESFCNLKGASDTLLVAGGRGVEAAARNQELLVWLRKNSRRARRIGSICTGRGNFCARSSVGGASRRAK